MQKYNLHAKTKFFVGVTIILSLLGTLYPIEHSRSLSNPYFDSFLLKMPKSHNSVAHDLTHVQLLMQKLKVLLKSLFMNISRNVPTIRRTSCIRFKLINTDVLVSHLWP